MEPDPKLAEQINSYAADLATNVPTTTGPPTINTPFYAIADSGCTAHFFSPTTPVCNKRPTTEPLSIHTPSGAIIHSTHEADLNCPNLPPAARHGHIVPQLATQPLLSIGQLCDAGCDVQFTATTVNIRHDNNIIMSGHRTPATKLWNLDIQTPTASASANAASGTAKPAELVTFAHAAMFSPTVSTLTEALRRGYLPEFAGLTLERLQKYPPLSIPMIKGHLDQERKNLRSTKSQPDQTEDALQSANSTTRTHACYVALMEPTGQTYMDLTGKFVAPSSSGNNYIMIIYNYDSNAILAIPLKNCKAETILIAYKTSHMQLCTAVLQPKLQ